ncbi:hypothetical protein BCR22_07460 [Enterococcus plantarum]|uniref:hypothetical protein n=1 Tax=Enterococcus plantarum TaxID=1077675 RepID=UPI00084DE7EE|nr:hypothetical protein [Enterococcus plantarum]OEG09424.1 hypothetical protein BCR22_07460 [Enterococcus plantarum]
MKIESWLSIIAVIVSVVSLFWQNYKENKHHKANLESEYFKEIYLDYLVNEIPKARKPIVFSNGKIIGTDQMIEVLNNIRQDSLFFKFEDNKYYDQIYSKLQSLENKYVESSDVNMTNDEFSKFHSETDSSMTEIYRIITNKYIGNDTK